MILVRTGRVELPSPCGHMDLNHARLPIPPRSQNRHKIATKSLLLQPNSLIILHMMLEPESKQAPHIGTKIAVLGESGDSPRSAQATLPEKSATKAPRRVLVLRNCRTCGREFFIRPDYLKRSQGRGTYCSNACRPVGYAKSTTRKRARLIWIERHNGAHPICRLCGKKADIHHADGNPLNNAPENQDPLCRSHHTSHEDRAFPRRRKRAEQMAALLDQMRNRKGRL